MSLALGLHLLGADDGDRTLNFEVVEVSVILQKCIDKYLESDILLG